LWELVLRLLIFQTTLVFYKLGSHFPDELYRRPRPGGPDAEASGQPSLEAKSRLPDEAELQRRADQLQAGSHLKKPIMCVIW